MPNIVDNLPDYRPFEDVLNAMKTGDCWCEKGSGDPRFSEHTKVCKDVQAIVASIKIRKRDSAMKTTADALRWALDILVEITYRGNPLTPDNQKSLTRAKEILALAEFVESAESPDYSKDSGFEALIDTTPAAYEFPMLKEKDCPICGKPYDSCRAIKSGGVEYLHDGRLFIRCWEEPDSRGFVKFVQETSYRKLCPICSEEYDQVYSARSSGKLYHHPGKLILCHDDSERR